MRLGGGEEEIQGTTSFRGRGFFIISYIYYKTLNKSEKDFHFLYSKYLKIL